MLAADYVFGDRKFGGNAQAITRGRWLHHTSFLWDYQPQRMALLQHPSKTPEYRQVWPAQANCVAFPAVAVKNPTQNRAAFWTLQQFFFIAAAAPGRARQLPRLMPPVSVNLGQGCLDCWLPSG